ncbi:MAG: efflux RND transporter periplasmic adaptor subunit [Pseudomonadota bacterium]
MKSTLRVLSAVALAAALAVAANAGHAAGTAPFDCLIEPSQVIEVRTPVEGLIDKVHVQRGDTIRRGQALVELLSSVERSTAESARYRAVMEGQISSARNRVDYANKKLARAADLAQQSFVSAQARDEADAERRVAESELQAALENRELAKIEHRRALDSLALRSVASPFNGVVLDRMLNPGDLADAGSGRKPVLRIAQIDPLRVDIVLPASLIGRVKAGMKVAVTPTGVPGTHTATVKMVDRVVDAASATFVARLELPNPTLGLPGGIRCKAEIEGVPNPAAAPRGIRSAP